MYTSSLILGLLAAAGTSVNALGCYSGGPTFGEMRGGSVDGAIEHFCRNYVPGTFGPGQISEHCYPFPENNSGDRVNMQIRNNQGGSRGISFQNCYDAFQTEHRACSHGSEQNHGSFFFKIDPNIGRCL